MKIKELIARYPIAAFFSIALTYTWSANLILLGCFKAEEYTYSLVSAFGPVFAAMLVSAFMNPERPEARTRSFFTVFTITFCIAGYLRWVSRIWWDHDTGLELYLGDALLAAMSAYVVASAFSRSAAVRALLRPMFEWRVSWRWYAVAILLWPLITYSGNVLAAAAGMHVPESPALPDKPLPVLILVSFFWTLFFNGPVLEEAGWRGFALPMLQKKFSPLIASVIIGFFWAVFHSVYLVLDGNWMMCWIRLGDIPLSIVFTWLYNKTKGKSLLPVLLMHASFNSVNDFLPRAKIPVYAILGIVTVVMIISDRMWIKQPGETREGSVGAG